MQYNYNIVRNKIASKHSICLEIKFVIIILTPLIINKYYIMYVCCIYIIYFSLMYIHCA